MEDSGDIEKGCRSWEEDIYWTHFHSIHFLQFLHGDFQNQLAVPKKFAENMKNKIGENVVLKGPSGSIWKVGLSAEEDGLFFKRGWDVFVKDHYLAENDVLMFKYNGDSRFEVLMFDHRSSCEKEASYFCKRVGYQEKEDAIGTKGKAGDGSEVVTELPREAGSAPTEEPHREEIVPETVKESRTPPRKRASPAKLDNGSSQAVIDNERKRRAIKSPSIYSPSPNSPKENSVVKRRSPRKDARFGNVYVSSKKADAKSPEQILALERAQAATKSDSFIVVMQPTHVYKRFYLSIPVDWADKHMSQKNQTLILRIKDKTWHCRYNYSSRNCGGISSGWRNFALDNYLLEFDVCLFDLGGSIDGTVVLDVAIFRVNGVDPIPAFPQAILPATHIGSYL